VSEEHRQQQRHRPSDRPGLPDPGGGAPLPPGNARLGPAGAAPRCFRSKN